MKFFMHYFKADIRRLCGNYAWYVGVIGVAFFLFFSLEGRGYVNENVLFTYLFATNMSGALITYVFCAFPYAFVFGQDMEHKYIRYQLIRGDLKSYVLSKSVVIYLSSVITMICGTLLFLLLCRTQLQWVSLETVAQDISKVGCYESVLKGGHYLIYCLLYALHMGILSGFLSLFAAFCSIYITNRVMVLVLPVLLFQVLTSININGYNIFVFYAYVKVFANDWHNLLFIFGLSAVPSVALTMGIYQSLKKRL